MRKFVGLFTFLCFCLVANAMHLGHFSLDVKDSLYTINEIDLQFTKLLDIDKLCQFELVNKTTDPMGYTHATYQQYYNGVEVEGGKVLVHAQGSNVMYINGAIMTPNQNPVKDVPSIVKRKVSSKFSSQIARDKSKLMLVPLFNDDSIVYRPAYIIRSEENKEYVYIDAENDVVLKSIPFEHHISFDGTANTYYYGNQTIKCSKNNSTYYLIDEERHICTYMASAVPENIVSYSPNDQIISGVNTYADLMLTAEQKLDSRYVEYFKRTLLMDSMYIPIFDNYLTVPSSTSTNFTGNYIKSIQITSILTDSWKGLLESNPDLFITVEDNLGQERYNNKANRVTRTPTSSNPVTFNINVPLWGDGYKIKIWDYDAIGNDLISTITFDMADVGTFTTSKVVASKIVCSSGTTNPIFDAHWGMEKTLDYYSETFGRESFDGYGSKVCQLVNVPLHVKEANNAFATYANEQFAYMVYNIGDGSSMRPVVELDVMAHEFTHLVTNWNANGGLKYENESGALNEGFSDIFGMCVENYVMGTPTWLIGHDLMIGKTNMRSMKNPYLSEDGNSPCPKAYKGNYWASTSTKPSKDNDQGGVHTNGTVLSYWFYVLCTGGTIKNEFGYTFTVKGLGIEKAQNIAYMLNQYYLTPYATYSDAVIGSLIITELLYGYGSWEYQAVQNAWGVVGFGQGYQPASVDLKEGTYMVFARRNDTTSYYKMSSELTTGTIRYKAYDIGTSILGTETTVQQDSIYLWEVSKVGTAYTLKSKGKYSTWTSGNSATLNTTPKQLTISCQNDGSYNVSFVDNTNTRYLSLNKTKGNEYFAFYSGTNQVANLRFEPYRYNPIPTITVKAKKPSDWGNTIRAWVWNTGEEGTWVDLEKDGEWYTYSRTCRELNIVFVNGTTWSTNGNQTVDITTSTSACYQIGGSSTNKRTYTLIDCIERETPTLNIGISAATLEVGETISCNATSNSDASITYSSANNAIAVVDADGIIRGVSEGNTTIKVSVAQTSLFTAKSQTISVEVTPTVTCKTVPYNEGFSSSIGDFSIVEVSKDAGLNYIWKWESSDYGMVAKSMYSKVYYAAEGWLISPCVEIPISGNTYCSFSHAAKFFSNVEDEMTLWISKNYKKGQPSTGNWDKLNISTYPTGSNWNFVNSGNVDITAYAGETISIAFKFVSSKTVAPQWEIKNFKIWNENTLTNIETIIDSPKYEKYLLNGQVVIQIDGKIYNTLGMPINNQ